MEVLTPHLIRDVTSRGSGPGPPAPDLPLGSAELKGGSASTARCNLTCMCDRPTNLSEDLPSAFRVALRTDFGDASVSHALRQCTQQIRITRLTGARWIGIANALSAVLVEEGRPPIAAATLRALFRRVSGKDQQPSLSSSQPFDAPTTQKREPSLELTGGSARPCLSDASASTRILEMRSRLRSIENDRKQE
jgi:hypothetical protein